MVAQWTTDSWQRQSKGVSWPFHHLNLDHVLVVRASGPSLSIEDWEAFVACASCGSVCVYGGIVKAEMTALLGAGRVLPPLLGLEGKSWHPTFSLLKSARLVQARAASDARKEARVRTRVVRRALARPFAR